MTDDAIPPDTKDWTWVLDRPCLQCGFVAADLDPRGLPTAIRGYAERWLRVLGRPEVGARPAPQVWSPLEYACHVRDVLRVFDGRVQQMLAEDGPTFASWDQDATALAERYGEQDPRQVGAELDRAAQGLAQTFAEVPEDGWQRPGLRSNGSSFTVASLGRYFAHDVVHHLADVAG